MANLEVTPVQLDALKKFKEVCDKADEIDDVHEYDWFALSIGFFLAQGLSPDDAHLLAVIVRYDLQYFDGTVPFVFS